MTIGLDWISTAFGLLGCFLVGKGKRYGWLLFATASALNIFVGLNAGIMGMVVGCICYCVLELKGWAEHGKEIKNSKKQLKERDKRIPEYES